ncbi:SDR family NAD(P)-dependent oxidoreductase [Peribacillus sp. NPDC097295]|uniref:SDR family NAD(P)-dependent oxidoreductase n=1 Tax=Peribacillus sp. NPDC097295 TaxID=3364402 RepID=UPI00381C4FCA
MGLLEGKVVIITGAGSGMGRAQSILFIQEGAKVVLADLNLDSITKLSEELSPDGDRALAVKVNITDKNEVDNLVSQTIEKFGQIDIVCNTAGLFDNHVPLLETSEDLWDKVMSVNTKGLFYITKAVLPYMIEKGKGVFVNVASVAGLSGSGGGIAYTASKHAAIGFTRQLATAYKSQGIRANIICPGFIETPMTAKQLEDPVIMEAVTRHSGRIGKPEDIAKASLFLASDYADYVNAVHIPVDGGMIMG